MMHMFSKDILELPGLAIECVQSNDGYCIVHYWGSQVLRIVFFKGSWATSYKLVDQEEGIWEIWHPDWLPPDEEALEVVFKSFDLTDWHHNAYFASNWNRLDALVVFVAVLGVWFPQISFLRALRAFRPFRIMVRFKKIKVVLGALLRAIPGIVNTMLFCILFWLVLSVLGVNWFSGLYSQCRIEDEELYFNADSDIGWWGCAEIGSNTSYTTSTYDSWNSTLGFTTTEFVDLYDDCFADAKAAEDYCDEDVIKYNFGKTECECYPGLIWWNSVLNFDHVFEALHSLFCISTLSGWNYVMYDAVDSTSYQQALKLDNRPEACLYFALIVVLCAFFSLNLIVSVIVDKFNEIKDEKDGSAFQTEEQSLWLSNERNLSRIQLTPTYSAPQHWFRKISFHVVEHPWFDPFIMFCIILNAMTMASDHYGMSTQFELALMIADYLFVIIFVLEAVMKISGYGFRQYIMNNWNKFDFVISIAGVVGLVTDELPGLSVLRIFRVGRLLRLLHKMKTLNALFWTLVYSIPSVWNIGLLLFVILFIYAVIAMHILTEYEHAQHDTVNADNFFNAMAMLYRVCTEDGWTDLYISYLEAWPSNQRYQVRIYFMSFFVVGTMIAINLFIAVVLDSFSENEKEFARKDQFELIEIWRDIWEYFDCDATKKVPAQDFIDILRLTPRSDAFIKKHAVIGPGFRKGNPFEDLYHHGDQTLETLAKKARESHTRSSHDLPVSSDSTDLGNESNNFKCSSEHSLQSSSSDVMCRSQVLNQRLRTKWTVQERKEKLRQCAATVNHEVMIRLLFKLRLRVQIEEEEHKPSNCCARISKLVLDICSSMGMKSPAAEQALNKYIIRHEDESPPGHIPGLDGLSCGSSIAESDPSGDAVTIVTEADMLVVGDENGQPQESGDGDGGKDSPDGTRDGTATPESEPSAEVKMLREEETAKETAGEHFDEGELTFYVAYDEALLAICSEVIGPELPDSFPLFAIDDPEGKTQLRIAEWYAIKHNCYDIFKEVALSIEHNKQYTDILPSRHIPKDKEEELKMNAPHQRAKDLNDLKKRVRNSYGQDVTVLLEEEEQDEEEEEKEIEANIVMNVVDNGNSNNLRMPATNQTNHVLNASVTHSHSDMITSQSLMGDLDDVLAVDHSGNEDDVDQANDFENSDTEKTDSKKAKRAEKTATLNNSNSNQSTTKRETAGESALTRFFTGMLR